MKVALVSSDNSYLVQRGGKHVYQKLLEKFLSLKGIRVTTYYPGREYYHISSFRKAILALRYGSLRFWDTFERRKVFLENLKGFFGSIEFADEDIVHCQDVLPALSLPNSKRSIITVHGYFAYEIIANNYRGRESSKEKELRNLLAIEEKAYNNASHIICVDIERRDYLVEEHKIPIEKITVLHNAVDTDKFLPVSDQEKASIRRRLGLPESKLLVLIPARFSPEKGVLFAAQASARLKENNDVFFLFIGGGPQRDEIESITQAQQNTLILDAISHDEFDLHFKAADIVLLPSIPFNNVREGSSMSLLEGMACGKIVISTRVGGTAEAIENGYNGFFVEQESSKSIADILLELSNGFSRYAIIGENASRAIKERYSFKVHVEKILTIYSEYLFDSENG